MATTYGIKIQKEYSKELGCPVLSVEIPENLKELLLTFACPGEFLNTSFYRTITERGEQITNTGERFQRYAVRTALKQEVNNRSRWSPLLDVFFLKELLDNGKVKVPLYGNTFRFQDFEFSEVRELIRCAEELRNPREILGNITIREED